MPAENVYMGNLVCVGMVSLLQTEWLKPQKCPVSEFRKLKVQDQGMVRGSCFWWGGGGKFVADPSPSPLRVCSNLQNSLATAVLPSSLPSSSHGVFSVFLPNFLFLQGHQVILNLRPIRMTSPYLITSAMTLLSNKVTF